jgi:hypothetical protein
MTRVAQHDHIIVVFAPQGIVKQMVDTQPIARIAITAMVSCQFERTFADDVPVFAMQIFDVSTGMLFSQTVMENLPKVVLVILSRHPGQRLAALRVMVVIGSFARHSLSLLDLAVRRPVCG